MKSKLFGCCILGVALALTLSISARPDRDDRAQDNAQCRDTENHAHNVQTPVTIRDVIPIPGSPLASTDLSWTDPGTERFYLADRSNSAVDIVDTEKDIYVARVTGYAGTPGTNGAGPNGVLVTPDGRLFAGDGNSKLQVADVDPKSADYLKFLVPTPGCTSNCGVNTADPTFAGGKQCNNGTTNTCGRADELGYDPADHIIMVNNDAPTAAAPAVAWPYATFVSTKTYKILGQIIFTGAGGAEQPVWDAAMQRFLVTLPGTTTQAPEVAIIDPKNLNLGIVATYPYPCTSLPGGSGNGANGAALGAFQHLLISACGEPIIVDALTGAVLHVVRDVGGGDEVWYNPGDGRFYVTSSDNTVVVVPPATAGPTVLGVIDAEDGSWLQNVPDMGGRNPSAFPENNRIFSPVRATTTSPDNTICATFGQLKGTGCIAVFDHKAGARD